MKKALLLSLLCLFMSTGSFAQIIQSRSETKETYYVKPTPEPVKSDKKYPCYQGELNLEYITTTSLQLETVHGVRINKYVFAGLGMGVRYASEMTFTSHDYEVMGTDLVYFPIFANVKGYYPVTDKIEPFLNLSLGGAVDVIDASVDGSSGFYCDFGTGIRLWKFAFGLGLAYQSFSVKDEYGDSWSWGNTGFYVKLGFQW